MRRLLATLFVLATVSTFAAEAHADTIVTIAVAGTANNFSISFDPANCSAVAAGYACADPSSTLTTATATSLEFDTNSAINGGGAAVTITLVTNAPYSYTLEEESFSRLSSTRLLRRARSSRQRPTSRPVIPSSQTGFRKPRAIRRHLRCPLR